MHDTEDGCVGADRERHDKDPQKRRPAIPAQRAQRIPDILACLVNPPRYPHGARILFHQRHVAKAEQRPPAGLVRRHTPLDVFLSLALDVILDVLVDTVQRSFFGGHRRSFLLRGAKDAGDGSSQLVPPTGFDLKLFPALGSQGVELGAPVVL